MTELLFHPEAETDYVAARGWYRARSRRAATRFEAEVERVLEMIRENAAAFPPYDDRHRFAIVRRFPYTVIFAIEPSYVHVVAVAHCSRAAGYWHGRS